jgi:hypothetical protein
VCAVILRGVEPRQSLVRSTVGEICAVSLRGVERREMAARSVSWVNRTSLAEAVAAGGCIVVSITPSFATQITPRLSKKNYSLVVKDKLLLVCQAGDVSELAGLYLA